MNVEEEIRKLQVEIIELEKESRLQRERIFVLYKKLQEITGAPVISSNKIAGKVSTGSFENFIGLRVIHFIGIIVLVTGLSIGIKYAIDKELISELARILLAYAAGLVLYILSYRLKSKYALFSAILFSGGAATLYFTTYGAFVYYNMIPFGLAFGIMIALTIFTVYNALLYNRQEIALLGLVGAYAIPFLISKNQENARLFFLYISLINFGILFLGMKKTWPLVTRLAQHITWFLFIGWAALGRAENNESTAFVFMSLFFLMFLFTGASERIRLNHSISISNVYQLVLNSLSLYLAAILTWGKDWKETDLAWITLVLSAIAAVQAFFFYYKYKDEKTQLYMGSLAFLFFLAFIAFQWEGLVVTFLWLLIAIIIFILGLVKKWRTVRISSIVLFGLTLFKIVVSDALTFTTVQKVISYISLGVLLLFVSYFYQRYRQYLFDEKDNEQHSAR
jgi:uncharacterized membrane protein